MPMKKHHYGHAGCKDFVWEKASRVYGKDPDKFRRDTMGNVICYSSYGKYSPMGWHIDHIRPQAKGGSDSPRNLQVLQSLANIRKSDHY